MESSNTVRQTITFNVEAPRLQGNSLCHFVRFRTLKESYEGKIEEKNNQLGTHIIPISYKASFSEADLKMSIATQWVQTDSID